MTQFDVEEFDWQEPDDYGVSIPPDAEEPPLVRLALDVLIELKDTVLRDWVEKVLPNLLDYFSLTPAKGMSLEAAQELVGASTNVKPDKREKTTNTLIEHKDQSLAVHLLNAAMGGWTLVKLADLDEIEQRLYLAGVTLHDLNKIVLKQLGSVRMDGKGWEQYQRGFETWGEALGLWEFIPRQYWQDAAFLAQNAEEGRGQNLTLANFPDLQIEPDSLVDLAEFVNFADLAASIAHHPQDLEQKQRVKAIIRRRLRGRYSLRHHRTTENRGLLTQAIHNAVMEKAKAAGWIPFLFFPDGVTYFVPREGAEPDVSDLVDTVRSHILQTAAKGLGGLISRQPKGIIRHSPDMLEVATVDVAAKTLIRETFRLIGDKRSPVTGTRREKIQKDFPELADLDWDYPSSIQVDRLAEGVRGLVGILEDYYGVSHEQATHALLNALGLNDCINAWERIPSAGGVPHGWYYIAGHYMRRHQGSLNDAELETVMSKAVQNVLTAWKEPKKQTAFPFLQNYISAVLSLSQNQEIPNFSGELRRYHLNKASRKREPICAICNSAFDVREEFSSYSNKRVTSLKKESLRGICSVCQVEKLLRRYSIGRGLSTEDEVVYLHLYPDYFFTPETASIMSRAYDNFAQSVFSDLDKELSKNNYNPKLIPRADVFRINVDPNKNQKRRLDKAEYPPGQMHGYYILGVPYLGKKPTDTESWFMPALLTLVAPLALGVKVIASRATLPPYDSGADFKETVIIDGVHNYWMHGMRRTSFRLDELKTAIPAAFSFYALTSQAYQDARKFPVWNALNTVSQSLDTSPLYVFHYADRIQENRKQGKRKIKDPSIGVALDLLQYYQSLVAYYGEDDSMKMIEQLVTVYACFYRAKSSAAYARLRPLNVAAKVVLESRPETCKEDLQLMIEGHLISLMDDIRDNKTDGLFAPGSKADDRRKNIEEFSNYFLEKVFLEYCRGERSLLRQNINLIRKASEAYYIKNYLKKFEENVKA
jgi:CRISPR-associated protein Csc3